jgi:excinuclease UvrABC nuclease subunit
MINPLTVDIASLPSVALSDRKAIPNSPAVYLMIDGDGSVQYIGKSCHPRQRVSEHVKAGRLNFSKLSAIKCLPCPCVKQHPLEKGLIARFNPPQNVQYRTDVLVLIDMEEKIAA